MNNRQHCLTCGQATTYELEIDRGTVKIVTEMARFINSKGINMVHPRKELEGTLLTSNEVGNLSRPRFHGLIAKVKGEPGNYAITRKGFAFLRGDKIERIAIIKKSTIDEPAHTQGHVGGLWISIDELVKDWLPYWSSCGYEVKAGRVLTKTEE